LEFGYTVTPDALCRYDMGKAYGYSISSEPSKSEELRDSWPGEYFLPNIPTFLMDVPNGNYKVTLTVGSPDRPAVTTVREGLGRIRLFELRTETGEAMLKSFAVHVDDGQLKLAFGGEAPWIRSVEIHRLSTLPTLFLAGDSTVTDQASGKFPYSGWGQMIGLFLSEEIAIANHARSGRSSLSFIQEGRLNLIAKKLRRDDFLLIQFAHNDEKENEIGTDPFTTYQQCLKQYLDVARTVGAMPVLVSPMHRRQFEENGCIRNTHGDYIEAMKQLAESEGVPFVDLAALSKAYFEMLGQERTKEVFLWAEPGQYAYLPEGAQDDTHFSEFGAIAIARLVANGIRAAGDERLRILLAPG
jgi:lysophospholipase L1-like esterase